jgi:hypothetical protein
MDSANLPVPTVGVTLPTNFWRLQAICNDVVRCANINMTDKLRGQVLAAIAELERLQRPSTPEQLSKHFAKLAMACKHGGNEAVDRRAMVALMLEHVHGYPEDVVRDACWKWVHERTFFPSIAEFCAMCDPVIEKRRAMLRVYERALHTTYDDKVRCSAVSGDSDEGGPRSIGNVVVQMTKRTA